mmetsp:Transcript_97091/g.302798  ORF Transcript_97091/g.302798 Transcript_97091/m.302798 type:complete len:271 (-) Transcript_97091:987-1799(-)
MTPRLLSRAWFSPARGGHLGAPWGLCSHDLRGAGAEHPRGARERGRRPSGECPGCCGPRKHPEVLFGPARPGQDARGRHRRRHHHQRRGDDPEAARGGAPRRQGPGGVGQSPGHGGGRRHHLRSDHRGGAAEAGERAREEQHPPDHDHSGLPPGHAGGHQARAGAPEHKGGQARTGCAPQHREDLAVLQVCRVGERSLWEDHRGCHQGGEDHRARRQGQVPGEPGERPEVPRAVFHRVHVGGRWLRAAAHACLAGDADLRVPRKDRAPRF